MTMPGQNSCGHLAAVTRHCAPHPAPTQNINNSVNHNWVQNVALRNLQFTMSIRDQRCVDECHL